MQYLCMYNYKLLLNRLALKMLAINIDRGSLFLACSDNEFHIFGPLKLIHFLRYSIFGRSRKRVELDPRKL